MSSTLTKAQHLTRACIGEVAALRIARVLAGAQFLSAHCGAIQQRTLHSVPNHLSAAAAPTGVHVEHGLPCVLRSSQRYSSQHDESQHDTRLLVGAYTPVTKRLWLERLARVGGNQPSRPLPPPTAKPPQPIVVTYPFSTDLELRENYRNPWGYMRVGRLLEDLDSLAGNVAFTHCDDGDAATMNPLLVTASVDKIRLRHALSINNDVTISGQVVWTGRSSLDIRMLLTQTALGNDPSVVALFTFVARDPITRKAAAINPVQPQSADDIAVFNERQAVADARRAQRRASAAPDTMPTGAGAAGGSQGWIKGLLQEGRTVMELPALAQRDAMLARDTSLSNTFVCQPQQRNMHDRIFGGFLMRRAYELAFSTTYMFAGTRPRFVEVDEVAFCHPVNVGDLLSFKSKVLHTSVAAEPSQTAAAAPGDTTTAQNGTSDQAAQRPRGTVHVEVVATVTQPERVESFITNTFYFTFSIDVGAASMHGHALKRVLPATAEEAEHMLRYYQRQAQLS